MMTMEEVVARENLNAAYRRVVANKGSPGEDGMKVNELGDYIRTHWEKIEGWLLSDKNRPKPVLKDEIEKTGGGMRKRGMRTGLDRFIQKPRQRGRQP